MKDGICWLIGAIPDRFSPTIQPRRLVTVFQFEKVICLTLGRRPDRWQRFIENLPKDWPFRSVQKFEAVDGKRCSPPTWWQAGRGAWGCYRSHLQIIEMCLNTGVESCLILEEDAFCCDGFTAKAEQFFGDLPDDWSMIYLGGQHLFADRRPPVPMNGSTFIPFNINRTHAYGIRGIGSLQSVYRHLNETQIWEDRHHVDHHLGRLHMRHELPIYCPSEWLIGQDEGPSEVCKKQCQRRMFPSATSYWNVPHDFVAIMGRSESGAGELQKIINDIKSPDPGNAALLNPERLQKLRNATDVSRSELLDILEPATQASDSRQQFWEGSLRAKLAYWFLKHIHVAASANSVPTCYVPELEPWIDTMHSILGNRLKVIFVKRNERVSAKGASQSIGNHFSVNAEAQAVAQAWNKSPSQWSVASLTLEYEEIIHCCDKTREKIASFLCSGPRQPGN